MQNLKHTILLSVEQQKKEKKMNPIALKDLCKDMQGVELFTVTVKVIKLWNSLDTNKNPLGVEAILVDNEVIIIMRSFIMFCRL